MQNQRKEFGYLSSSILTSVFRGILVGLFSGFTVSLFRYFITLIFDRFQKGFILAHKAPWILMAILLIYLFFSLIIGRLISGRAGNFQRSHAGAGRSQHPGRCS